MRHLYEAYTPEMQVLKPYLKEIGEKLSKLRISVQDAEFREIEIPKPTALSSINKIIRAEYEVYGNFKCVLALLKHITGGVTVGSFENTGRGKVTAIEVNAEYGDTSGKVTDCFVAQISTESIRQMQKLSSERERANAVIKDRHDISGAIQRRMSLSANPNIKAILSKAKALGFYTKGASIKVVDDGDGDGEYITFDVDGLEWESEQWKPGVPHITVSVRKSWGRRGYRFDLDDNVFVYPYFNGSTFSISENDSSADYNYAVKSLKEIALKIEQARILADFIGTFTYRDLLVE